MNRWHLEWRRLFAAGADHDSEPGALLDAAGANTRALVVEWGRPGDWPALAALWQAVQTEIGWPAPLIALNGRDAFQLWVPLAELVPAAVAHQIARALASRWLPRLPPGAMAQRLACWPQRDEAGVSPWGHAAQVPARQAGAEPRWSAFVSPDLAALFGNEPALDIDPGDEAQAELMARHQPVSAALWARARQMLLATEPQSAACSDPTGALLGQAGGAGAAFASAPASPPDLRGPYDDPALFLKAVMNHPAVPLAQRIEAARALLAHAPPRP
jgi:hypothetical protein